MYKYIYITYINIYIYIHAAKRKVQQKVAKQVFDVTNNNNNINDPTTPSLPAIEITDNFFMPKKVILRSDGNIYVYILYDIMYITI